MNGILILSELFPDHANPGKGMFVRGQAEELSERLAVDIVAPIPMPLPRRKFKPQREWASQVPRKSKVRNADLFRPRYFDFPRFSVFLNSYSMLIATLKCVVRERLRFDLIHCHRIYPEGYVGVLLGSLLRKPVCITIHGADFNHYVERVPSSPDIYGEHPAAYSYIRRSMIYALQKSNRLIPVSDELRERAVRLGVDERKIVTIRNGVDLRRFKPLGQVRARSELGIQAEGKIVLFVGTLIPRKDPETLVKAFEEVRKAKREAILVIVGRGPLKEALEDYVRTSELAGVRFLDEVPDEAVPLWMNACDVLVMPSIYESFGCVLLEALACSRPIVTTCTGAIPEVYKDGQHGLLVRPGQPGELAQAILTALDREWDVDSLVAFARQYSWGKIAEQLCQQYEQMLSATPKVVKEQPLRLGGKI